MKILLLILLVATSNSFGQTSSDILLMSPEERKFLSMSVKEVADNYVTLGINKKANDFYRSMINIYPIGDLAHQVANKINVDLDDEKTYANFIMLGDKESERNRFNYALSYYLMANELENNSELYKKISVTYQEMGNVDKAEYYEGLSIQSDDSLENEIIEENLTSN